MAEQLFQIGVKGLIRNDKGQILMVHLPDWGYNPAHWDLPGGRMDPGETFLETLKRELQEEIGVTYTGVPRQVMGMLTNITIPVGEERIPLVFMIYEVQLPSGYEVRLDSNSAEDAYEWFSPEEAADNMAIKFSPEFCELVRNL
jgi:mutator protein MutT